MNLKYLSVLTVFSKEIALLELVSRDSSIFVPILSFQLKHTKSWHKNCACLSQLNEIILFNLVDYGRKISFFFQLKYFKLGFVYFTEALVGDSWLCKADSNLMYM